MEEPLRVESIKEGDGSNYPKSGDIITVQYTGSLKDGSKSFDSTIDRGEPFMCKLGHGQVIRGWEEGILKVSLGERAILHIRSDYGYGEMGAGSLIPPNSDLKFEVHLLAINDLKAPTALTASQSNDNGNEDNNENENNNENEDDSEIEDSNVNEDNNENEDDDENEHDDENEDDDEV